MMMKRKWLYGLELCVFGLLIGVAFLGCAGPRTAVEPKDVQVFIDDARDSISLAQEAGAGELASEQIARAESSLARAEEAAKEEDRGVESIRLASDAKAKAEAAHAVSRQAKAHEKEIDELYSDRAQEVAALKAARKIASEAEKDKAEEVQECKRNIEQLEKERKRELTAVRSAMRAAEDRADQKERELFKAESDFEATEEKLEEALKEIRAYSDRVGRIEREKAGELDAVRDALNDAERDARKAEAKAKEYSAKIADIERKQKKEIAIHVAKEADAQKKAAKAVVKKEMLRGKPNLEALEEVRKSIEGWRIAWQTRDADRYMSYYADHAEITKVLVAQGKENARELSKDEMRREMENVFVQNVQFNMGKPVLEAGSDAVRATFEFFKQASAEAYEGRKDILKHDKWIKELLFREVKRNWKIVKEDWRLYRDIPEYAER